MLRDLEDGGRRPRPRAAPVRRAAERRGARGRRARCRWRAARAPRLRARGHAAAHPAARRRCPRGRRRASAIGCSPVCRWQGDEAAAEIIRVLRREPRRLVGLLQRGPGGLLLEPTGDGGRGELLVREQDSVRRRPGRSRGRRARRRRGARARPGQGDRAAGPAGRAGRDLPVRGAERRPADRFPAGGRGAGRRGAAGGAGQAGRPARAAAGHDRRRRRARLRRCGLRRARCRPGQSRRLAPGRGDRRRRPLRAAGRCAGPGGQAARQLGLLPGPRAADAAGGAVQRPVLAAPGRGPRLPRGAPVVRPARAQAPASLRARADALARAAHLRAGAGGGRRRARRRRRRLCSRA